MTTTNFSSYLSENSHTIDTARRIIMSSEKRTPAQKACLKSLNEIRHAPDEPSRVAALKRLVENSQKVIDEANAE